jgi:hypothetical protein
MHALLPLPPRAFAGAGMLVKASATRGARPGAAHLRLWRGLSRPNAGA